MGANFFPTHDGGNAATSPNNTDSDPATSSVVSTTPWYPCISVVARRCELYNSFRIHLSDHNTASSCLFSAHLRKGDPLHDRDLSNSMPAEAEAASHILDPSRLSFESVWTRRRILASYWLVVVLAIPLWWKATSIDRLSLPESRVRGLSKKEVRVKGFVVLVCVFIC